MEPPKFPTTLDFFWLYASCCCITKSFKERRSLWSSEKMANGRIYYSWRKLFHRHRRIPLFQITPWSSKSLPIALPNRCPRCSKSLPPFQRTRICLSDGHVQRFTFPDSLVMPNGWNITELCPAPGIIYSRGGLLPGTEANACWGSILKPRRPMSLCDQGSFVTVHSSKIVYFVKTRFAPVPPAWKTCR